MKTVKTIPYTLEIMIRGYRIKLTQDLSPSPHNFGHYRWAIEDKKGNLVSTGYSMGIAPDKVTVKDLEEFFKRWRHDQRR